MNRWDDEPRFKRELAKNVGFALFCLFVAYVATIALIVSHP